MHFSIRQLANRSLLALSVSVLVASAAIAEDVTKSPTYASQIRPILADNCFACHGADAESRAADLRLDVREEAISAGAIVPSDTDGSTILERITSDDPDLVMPPPDTKKSLTDEQIKLLQAWIDDGAAYEDHWAFSAPGKPSVPDVKDLDWCRNEIDRFILAKLESLGVSPNEPAPGYAIVRRLSLDIRGLPPSTTEVEEFLQAYEEDEDQAVSDFIDRFMQSTAWGEHRARYWLDAARYADTHGLHFDNYREIFPYRDWVIRAFNKNMPFDQFTLDQLAGDLVESPTNDQLIATGFQRCNITTNEGGTIDEENLALYASDRVQTFGWVYLGLTTNCAQCHDHKFDPFTMRDYYSLAAFFRNTTQPAKDGNSKDGRSATILVPTLEDKKRLSELESLIAQNEASLSRRKKEAQTDFKQWAEHIDGLDFELDSLSKDLALVLPNVVQQSPKPKNDAEAKKSTQPKLIDGVLGKAQPITAESTITIKGIGDFAHGQAFSVGTWYRPDSKRAAGGVVARMNEANAYRGWDLYKDANGYAVHIIDHWPDNALKVMTRDNVVTPGKWQHVAFTYDGSGKPDGIKIFVDGVAVPTRIQTNALKPDANIRSTVDLRIGGRSGNQVLNGSAIQDVHLYSRVLTKSETQSLATRRAMQTIARKTPKERSKQELNRLLDFYLAKHDKEYPKLTASLAGLKSEQVAINKRSPITHIQKEKPNSQAMAHILMRGAYDAKGDEVVANSPGFLHPYPEDAPRNRLGLARWLIDESNPLTARVTVNRFWQEIFGQGLVVTPEDFGVMGSPPSNQELLDWLAVDFRTSGWDVKSFFKKILMSSAYRQSANVGPEKLRVDRHNDFVSRGPGYRIDAEMIRDYALSVSGLLSDKMYGSGTRPYQPTNIWNIVGLPGGDTRNYKQDTGENLYRRSIYTFWKRMAPPPSMEALNAPSREVCTVRRERTNTPLQALVTLNDVQFVEAARVLAQSVISKNKSADDQSMLNEITLRVLSRRFADVETEIALQSLNALRKHYQNDQEAASKLIASGDAPTAKDIEPSELAAWTMLCNQLLNLDEALCK